MKMFLINFAADTWPLVFEKKELSFLLPYFSCIRTKDWSIHTTIYIMHLLALINEFIVSQ